jgi:hypothetical protein
MYLVFLDHAYRKDKICISLFHMHKKSLPASKSSEICTRDESGTLAIIGASSIADRIFNSNLPILKIYLKITNG